MKTIAFITAMDSEFAAIKSLYDFSDGTEEVTAVAYDKKILLIKSGIGKVHAALAADKAYRSDADVIITTGLAGGIDNSLTQGDVVLAERVCYHDVWCGTPNVKGQVQDLPPYFETPRYILEKITRAVPQYFNLGLTVTGDQFLTDAGRLREIKADFPEALAVDMESAAIAQVCYLRRIPFISLRIISDVVGKTNQQAEYDNFWQSVPQKASEMADIVVKHFPAE